MTRSLAIAALMAGAVLASVFPGSTAHAAAAAAQAPAAPKGDPAKGQTLAAGVCAGCHGADGNSGVPANPTLAGQHAGYTAKQLANFKSGERKNAIMQGMAATLSDADMKNIAAWLATQKAKPGFAKEKELVALGERIWRGGIADRQIAACAGCHSPNGAGIPAWAPVQAGETAQLLRIATQSVIVADAHRPRYQMLDTVLGK